MQVFSGTIKSSQSSAINTAPALTTQPETEVKMAKASLPKTNPEYHHQNHGATVGRVETPEYKAWKAMKQRCYGGPRTIGWKNYGGKGIKVCEQWRHSFRQFLQDMGPKPTPKHTIDRIDANKDYSPENCRWATMVEQRRNQPSIRPVTHNGVTHIITDWAKITGVPEESISARLRNGWPVEKALFAPIGSTRKVSHPMQVRVMCRLREAGHSYVEIAALWNLTPEYISQLVRRRGSAKNGLFEYSLIVQ